jgi:hypothetical protein
MPAQYRRRLAPLARIARFAPSKDIGFHSGPIKEVLQSFHRTVNPHVSRQSLIVHLGEYFSMHFQW